MDLFARQTWENYDPAGLIAERLKAIKSAIPADVRTILDAGCGNGAITNALEADYEILGVDFSPAALEHVRAPKLLASVTDLPLDDGSFDLVMCNEVWEHLSSEDLHQAVAEAIRVTRRHLLVGVPYREQLEAGLIRCDACAKVFHVYGHRQSFTRRKLDRLLGLPAVWHQTLGPRQRRHHLPLLRFRQHSLGQWHHPAFPVSCPHCGNTDFPRKSSLLTKAVNALDRVRLTQPRYWLLSLYRLPGNFKSPKAAR